MRAEAPEKSISEEVRVIESECRRKRGQRREVPMVPEVLQEIKRAGRVI